MRDAVKDDALLEGTRYGIHLRVEVEDPDGAWVELTDLSGTDWVREVQWSDSLDQAVMSGRVILHRNVGTLSLAPLLEASTLNRDAGAAYAPLLHPARRIRISTAAATPGSAPSVAGPLYVQQPWREVFLGVIDQVDAGTGSAVTLQFRDIGAELLNTFIEEEREYGSDVGTAVEDVMQSILDDNATGVTLVVPESPGFAILPYLQAADTNVFEALRALALQFGWDVRYRYGAEDAFQLTLWKPERTAPTSLHAFGPSQYLDVKALAIADADIRNVVAVTYPGGAAPVVRTSAPSIAIYGRRFLGLGLDTASNIDTQVEAEALADAALADLATPPLDQTIENLFWPRVQLGDFYTWEANDVHYDTDQDLAVVSYQHRLAGGSGRTQIACRGAPAGAYRRWLRGEGTGVGAPKAEVSSFDYRVNPLTNEVEVFGTVNELCQSLEWWLAERFDEGGTDPLAASPALIDGLGTTKQFTFTFTLPDGKATTLYIQPYGGAAAALPLGLLYETPVARSPRTTLTWQPRDPTGRVRAEWAQVAFSVRPAIPAHPGGAGTITGATSTTLTDSGAAWTPDEFAYDANERRFFYVRAGGQVARIVGNTATELEVFPAWDPDVALPSGTYAIYEGATLYKLGESLEGFVPVIAPIYLQRGAADTLIEFYSEINRTEPEPVQRFTIDQDDTPEIEGLVMVETLPLEISVSVLGIDDDVKRARCYIKKGGWPTTDGTEDGPIDSGWLRQDEVIEDFAFTMSVDAGTWYGIAVPVNSYNDTGPREAATIVIGGVASSDESLSAVVIEKLVNAGVLYHRIGWDHSAGLESPATAYELRVYGYRSDRGVGTKALLTAVNRRAWQDSAAGYDANPADDANDTSGEGSVQNAAGTDGTEITRTWYYTVELWEAGVLVASYPVSRTDTYGINDPSAFSLAAEVESSYGGKDYVTAVFAYTSNEPWKSLATELWQQEDNAVFDPAEAILLKTVPNGVKLDTIKLKQPGATPVFSYWIRNVTHDGSAASAFVGPVDCDFDGAL